MTAKVKEEMIEAFARRGVGAEWSESDGWTHAAFEIGENAYAVSMTPIDTNGDGRLEAVLKAFHGRMESGDESIDLWTTLKGDDGDPARTGSGWVDDPEAIVEQTVKVARAHAERRRRIPRFGKM